MLKVYVAGAYSADNVMDVLKNIGKGEDYCAMLFMKGYSPFCPWFDRQYVIKYWNKNITTQMLFDASLEWLKCADVLFVIPDWEDSEGTKAEIKEAQWLNIPVVFSIESLDAFNYNNRDNLK